MTILETLASRAYTGIGDHDREEFWLYSKRAHQASIWRAAKAGVPHSLTVHDIDQMLVDQYWCCAISGIPLQNPSGRPHPFGPSLDRQVPKLGYVLGNVRIVCNLANYAMSKWGENPVREFALALHMAKQWND
jgi:hypothetical protein